MTATFDPAISSQEDAATLEELGYTQELHRGIGGYAAFAVRILVRLDPHHGVRVLPAGLRARRPRVLLHLADRVPLPVLRLPGVRRAVRQVPGGRRDLPVVATAGRQRRRLVRGLVHADRLHRVHRRAGHRDADRPAADLERLPDRRWRHGPAVGHRVRATASSSAPITIVLCTIISAAGVRFMARITVTGVTLEIIGVVLIIGAMFLNAERNPVARGGRHRRPRHRHAATCPHSSRRC